jgi:16S rRNA G966 N2-methylase RsmD
MKKQKSEGNITELLKKGMAKEDIKKFLAKKKIPFSDEEIEKERLNLKGKEKFSSPEKMMFNAEDLRFATPEIVAEYRAERITGKIIADLCCGIGSQSIAFAKKFLKVYAVDKDPRKIECAKANAKAVGAENIEFICADVFDDSTIKLISDSDAIFCDPERAPEEKERKLEAIPFVELIRKKYSKITKNIAIELPPQISPEKIDSKKYNCEKEYLSLRGKLNRLDIYFGELKQCETSAVLLPGKERIESKGEIFSGKKSQILSYLYEINPAVEKAGLAGEAAKIFHGELFACFKSSRASYFTSNESIGIHFFERYKVIASCPNSAREIISVLQECHAGKAVLRGNVQPDEYWLIRKTIEQKLSGTAEFQVFFLGGTVAVARPL